MFTNAISNPYDFFKVNSLSRISNIQLDVKELVRDVIILGCIVKKEKLEGFMIVFLATLAIAGGLSL